MKTRQTLLKGMRIAVLVTAVSLVLPHKVVAVPYITPSTPSYRGVSRGYVQHIVAENRVARGRTPIVNVRAIDLRMRQLGYFEQYIAAQEWMEASHHAALTAKLGGGADHSGIRFEQYLRALEGSR